ncbi:hypothetical protein LV79_000334 [Actinokineospora globicatena]|nr:hypothetical protein [Actinokineospora globicatena]GLW81202.1 hypothetical protein Aglo01_56830 [Actinokineospora globicatena]GLW88395.1 hypothetical protein Aglo02_60340 [Actinokineospora globicatena]
MITEGPCREVARGYPRLVFTTYRARWEIILGIALVAAAAGALGHFVVRQEVGSGLVVLPATMALLAVFTLRSRRLLVSDEHCVLEGNGVRVTFRWVDLVERKRGTLYFTTGLVEHNDDWMSRSAAKRVKWRVPAYQFLRDQSVLPTGLHR